MTGPAPGSLTRLQRLGYWLDRAGQEALYPLGGLALAIIFARGLPWLLDVLILERLAHG